MPWSKVGNLTPSVSTLADTYTRPTDWLPLPTVNVGEQKVVALNAVYPAEGANFASLSCAGAYTVDWGDGTAPASFAANAQADHLYTYASLSAATNTTRGYRQAIVTVTPQAGQNFTGVNLARKHAQAGLPTTPSTGWLDIRMAGASISTLQIGMNTGSVSVVQPSLLEQLEFVGPSAITNISYLFGECFALQSIKGSQFTANATTAAGLLYNSNVLRSLVDLNLGNVVNDGNGMFANQKALQRVSGLNLAKISTAANMFQGCTALAEVNDLNISTTTDTTSMFDGCTSLRTVTTINAAACPTFTSMFNTCRSLKTVTGLTSTAGTAFNSMFNGCTSLQVVSAFNTAQATAFNNMFSGCSSVQQIPVFNTAKGTNFTSMFNSCYALTAIPALNMAAATATTSFVAGCASLSSVGVTGLKISTSFASCRLGSAALDALYTQLGTGAGQTLTVTGNYGTTADTPSIATAKSWTVTGT